MYVSVSRFFCLVLFCSVLFFLLSLLFWSMAGLTQCQCLEVLVLHRIIKMPNSLRRDPNLSLEKKKKTLFFCIFPEMQVHKQIRILQC